MKGGVKLRVAKTLLEIDLPNNAGQPPPNMDHHQDKMNAHLY
jgi:hypothetical protein